MYGVQVQVTIRDFWEPPRKEWFFVKSSSGKPYSFETESEAEDFIYKWYRYELAGTVRVAKLKK